MSFPLSPKNLPDATPYIADAWQSIQGHDRSSVQAVEEAVELPYSPSPVENAEPMPSVRSRTVVVIAGRPFEYWPRGGGLIRMIAFVAPRRPHEHAKPLRAKMNNVNGKSSAALSCLDVFDARFLRVHVSERETTLQLHPLCLLPLPIYT